MRIRSNGERETGVIYQIVEASHCEPPNLKEKDTCEMKQLRLGSRQFRGLDS